MSEQGFLLDLGGIGRENCAGMARGDLGE